MGLPVYRIFAIRYAHRDTRTNEVFLHDFHEAPIGMDYFVWAITNNERTIVVDLGFTKAVGEARGRTFLREPAQGLAEVGIDAANVSDVIVSHFHYDHTGNYAAFPRARFHVQESEMAFWTGRDGPQPAFRRSLELDDLLALVRLNYEGRLAFVDGSAEIAPGVQVERVGGHTAGMQIITVQTARGRAVLTSDATHYYANLERGVPFMTLHDISGVYHGFARIRALADAPELIMAGHDPLVLDRFPAVGDGIVLLE